MTTWADLMALVPSPHTITVEAHVGSGPYGDHYDPPVSVSPCMVDHKRRLVRVQTQTAAGSEAVSSTTVYAPPHTTAPAGSRITLPSGHTAIVLARNERDDAGLGLPAHTELVLE